MKEIKISGGKSAIVDDEDYEYISSYKWRYLAGYAARAIFVGDKQKAILMHRVINKTPEGFDTDHINGNRLDNRRSNLRTASRSQNLINKGKQSNNTSGYKGVSWHKVVGAWGVNIGLNGKCVHAGYFDSIEDAVRARKKLERFFYGDFSHRGEKCA